MSKLTILERNLPLRAIPEQELNNQIIGVFMPWLSKLLSLTDEVSANRLEMALPAIKTQCIGMGFAEIVKMFEMYVDGKMSLQPMTNFFDRILLGKIVAEYKRIQNEKKSTVKKEIPMPENEKEKQHDAILERVKKFFKENRYIEVKDFYVYDILVLRGLIKLTHKEKESIKEDAIYILKSEYSEKKATSRDDYNNIQNILKGLENKTHSKIIVKCKQLASEQYFRNTFKN